MSPLQSTTLIAIIYIQTCISASLTKTIQPSGEIWLQQSGLNLKPSQATEYNTISLGQIMSIEFDFAFHGRSNSPRTGYQENFFRIGYDTCCSAGCNGEGSSYPAMFLARSHIGDILDIKVSNGETCGATNYLSDYTLSTTQTHHIKISLNNTQVTVHITGGNKLSYTKKWERTQTPVYYIGDELNVFFISDTFYSTPYNVGNATFNNIIIKSSMQSTFVPTHAPNNNQIPSSTLPTKIPSKYPTKNPTVYHTNNPTINPTIYPSVTPSKSPTNEPTMNPTYLPTQIPTIVPTEIPTNSPTIIPTINPTRTRNPTTIPTINPTNEPTVNPSITPTFMPTNSPLFNPSKNPSKNPTVIPTILTGKPTYSPSIIPSIVFIKENKNNNLNNKNANIIEKDSPLRYLPLIIIIVFIIVCCMWIILCAYTSTKKQQRNSTISINDMSDNDENEDIVHNGTKKQRNSTISINDESDNDENEDTVHNGTKKLSVLSPVQNENVQNTGAKNTQSQYKSSTSISTTSTSSSTSTSTDSIMNKIYTSIIMNNDLYEV